MTTPTDEELMAYADGALQPAERHRIDQLIAADPTLQEQIAIFRQTSAPLAALFADKVSEPVPAHSEKR